MSEMAQRRVGDQYEILRPLGKGGMGEVFLAHDNRLDRPVAIKAVRSSLIGDSHVRARFVREARSASLVVHPYVATVFDVVHDEGQIYLVMEYIEGRPLHRYARETDLSVEERLRLVSEIGEALGAIHRHGLVHRDLKPANVMVTRDGHVKVLDFGLVRHTGLVTENEDTADDRVFRESLTTAGVVAGTVAYMSPEQLRGEDVDSRSDLFSLGILAYELITGEHPFQRPSLVDTMHAILHEEPSGASAPRLFTEWPQLRRFLDRALSKTRDKRFASGEEVVASIQALLEGQTLPEFRALARRRRRRRVAVGLIAAAALATAAARWLLSTPPSRYAPRMTIAVAPFVDRTGVEEGPLRSVMVADFLATDLQGSSLVRAVGPDQVAPLLEGVGGDAPPATLVHRIADGTRIDYLLAGALYREQDTYHASASLIPATGGEALPLARVEGPTVARVAERLSSALRRTLPEVTLLTAIRDDRTRLEDQLSGSEEARLLYQKGVMALRDGKLVEAIDQLDKAAVTDPEFALAHGRLAEALFEAGYGRRARESATRATTADRGRSGPAGRRLTLTLRAISARVYSRTEEAVEASGRLAELDPDDPQVLAAHAIDLLRAGRVEQALGASERALAADPANAGLHLLRARVLLQTGSYDEAARVLDEAERLFELVNSVEGTARAALNRGRGLRMRGRFEQAAAEIGRAHALLEAIEAPALAASALLERVKVDIQQARLANASEDLDRLAVVAEETGNLGLLCEASALLGASQFARGSYVEAETALRAAVDLARRLENDLLLVDPLSNLATLLLYVGRRSEALLLAEESLELGRGLDRGYIERNALLLISFLRYLQGDVDGAIEACNQVLQAGGGESHDRDTGWARMSLAEIRHGRGELEAALELSDGAVATFRRLEMPRELGYALAQRARLLTDLRRTRAAAADLEEAGRIAGAESAGMGELLARLDWVRGADAGYRGDWRGAIRHVLRALETAAGEVPTTSAPLRVLLCEARLGLGDGAGAIDSCRVAVETPGAAAADRAAARAALAAALERSGRFEEARRQATQSLEATERMGLALPLAAAAAVLLELPAPYAPEQPDRLRRHGAAALERYLASAPARDRESLRARYDLARLRAGLAPPGEPGV